MNRGLENWFRRKTMSLLKSVAFISLLCLLLCSTELYALSSNEVKLEKPKATFSLGGLGKSLNGTMDGIGRSLDGTVNGVGKSLDETAKGVGEFLDGTVKGVGESLGGTVDGIGEFLEENGEAIVVVGVVFLYMIAECYSYDSGYHHGHHYHCH